jgi:hypothetical protein
LLLFLRPLLHLRLQLLKVHIHLFPLHYLAVDLLVVCFLLLQEQMDYSILLHLHLLILRQLLVHLDYLMLDNYPLHHHLML